MGLQCSCHTSYPWNQKTPPTTPTLPTYSSLKTPSPIPTPQKIPSPIPPTPPPRENTEDFQSDHITISIDQGSDEIQIEDQLEDYHEPSPPDQVDGRIKKPNVWFEDDEFNLASDDAPDDLFDIEKTENDTMLDDDKFNDKLEAPIQILAKAQQLPHPILTYEKIDEHAKNANAEVRSSFETLIQYLIKGIDENTYEKILLARAIVAWMSVQSIDTEHYGEPNEESPNGLLQCLKNKTMTYATCFAILCRKANLQCVRITGYVKAARYEPGDTDIPETTWNAVYVESGWEIIHPYWICRALYGHNLGGWVKVEKDGQSMRSKEQAFAGIVRSTFQDRYFMPNPKEFLYECCAKDPEWQLVKHQVSYKSEFAKMPYLLPPFFGVGLSLTSIKECELESKNGFCKIELKGKPSNAHMLVLYYELFKKSDDAGQPTYDQTSRMVFNVRASDMFAFDIRFLETGTYKLVVYGGPHKSPALRLFETKINCKGKLAKCNLLPLSCAKVGWGPGPFSREAGLLMPTRVSGLIGVSKTTKTSEMTFHLQDSNREYSAVVHGEVDGQRKAFDGNTELIIDGRLLKIKVTIPGEGEYGLAINVHTPVEKNVCNYLLSTHTFKGIKATIWCRDEDGLCLPREVTVA